jgi:excisionase family DNA binding protein
MPVRIKQGGRILSQKENELSEKSFTVQEVAELESVHIETVRRWIRGGELTAKFINGYKIKESDYRAFLERRTKSAA